MSVLFGMKHSIMGLEFEKTRRNGFRKTCFIDKQGPEKKKETEWQDYVRNIKMWVTFIKVFVK